MTVSAVVERQLRQRIVDAVCTTASVPIGFFNARTVAKCDFAVGQRDLHACRRLGAECGQRLPRAEHVEDGPPAHPPDRSGCWR